nr:sodium:calcium antiporter [Planctomycetota bacterium]
MSAATLTVLILALLAMVAGAELLVRGAAGLARRLGLSSLFVGMTVVGFGTSAPELASSLAAAARGQDGIALGNVVGSNLFNVLVVLGAASLARPIAARLALLRTELRIALLASLAPYLALAGGGVIGRGAGVLLLAGLGLSLWRGLRAGRAEAAAAGPVELPRGPRAVALELLFAAAGLALLVGGAVPFVGAAAELARVAGLSELAIGLTVVAVGSSMPVLGATVGAARLGESERALGNVIGPHSCELFGHPGGSWAPP